MMRPFMIALRRCMFAFPLLFGPWLIATGYLLVWQAITKTGPVNDPITRGVVLGCGALCVMWAIHGLASGPRIVRNWWLLTCSLMNLYFGVSAFGTPSDPEYLRYVLIPINFIWSLYLFTLFMKRRQEAQE